MELPRERIDRLQAGFCLAQPMTLYFQAGTSVIQSLPTSCHVLHITIALGLRPRLPSKAPRQVIHRPNMCTHDAQVEPSTGTAASAAVPCKAAAAQQAAVGRQLPPLGWRADAGAGAARRTSPQAQPACPQGALAAPAAASLAPASAGASAAQPARLQPMQEALLGRLVAEAAEAQCRAGELARQVQGLEQANR